MKPTAFARTEDSTFLAPEISRQHGKQHRKYESWLRWFLSDSWALEYFTMAMSVAALAVISVTLILHNGEPLDNWPLSVQLSTVLSTLATIMKGCMLLPVCACLSQLKWLWYIHKAKSLQDFQIFDHASRGPLGAILLLFRLNFWHMASLGSLVTLLSLASDSFVQQTVSYRSRLHAQGNTTATIPYAQHFETGPNGQRTLFLNQPLTAATYNGVYSKNLTRSTSSITPYCPSGNCDFPDYASLAVCSNCHNVSSLLLSRYGPYRPDGVNESTHIRDYSLPNGHRFLSTPRQLLFLNISSSGPLNTRLALNSDDLLKYQSAATILNISVITGSDVYDAPDQAAFDCVLSFCAKSYSARASLNYFNETSLDVFDAFYPAVPRLSGLGVSESITFDVPSTHLTTIGDRNRTFSVRSSTLGSMRYSLQATLSGATGTDFRGEPMFTTGIAQGFHYSGLENIEATLANVADALTNAMRAESNDQVQGTVFVVETFIHVQWIWLLYPVIMVILSIFLLGLTIWRSRRDDVPNWRSSVLAVMEHGVNTSIRDETNSDLANGIDVDLAVPAGKEKAGDLEIWAEDVSVQLRRRGPSDRVFGLTVT